MDEIYEILKNKNVSEQELLKLLNTCPEKVFSVIVSSSSILSANLLKLFLLLEGENNHLQEAVFLHHQFPLAIIENFANSLSVEQRKLAAKHQSLSFVSMERLLEDDDWEVRHEVLFNPTMPQSLRNLYLDEIYD